MLVCPHCCSMEMIKNEKKRNCKHCQKRVITGYTDKAYFPDTDSEIIQLTKEELGICSMARVLEISVTTLLKRILLIASKIKQPPIAVR